MSAPYEKAISSVTNLISEFITDDDLAAKLNVEMERISAGIRSELLNTTTTPKVDAFVKLLIAFKDVIVPLLRPVGAGCMTAFGMYMHYRGTPLDGATQIVMDGAFPAWGASRHVNKQTEQKEKTERHALGDWDTED